MVNTFYDAYTILNKVYSDKAYLTQAINSTTIEELNRKKTVKICYGVLDKDIELSFYISKFADKSPKLVIRTLLKIAFYCIKYLEKHPYSVTDNIVELAKKLGKGGNAGFLNAVIRKFAKAIPELPSGDSESALSIRYSYPLFAIKQLINDYGFETAKKIIACDEEAQYVRFANESEAESYLSSLKVEYQKTPYSDLFLTKGLRINDDFNNGLFTFQSIGSRAICEAVGKGKKLLDCCSAPGGKAVYLSKYFDSVIACELHEHRALLINSYIERMKVNNVEVVVCDSTKSNNSFVNGFDSVLCDVPCSGYGTLKSNPDIKLKDRSELVGLNSIQLSILKNCSNYVELNGTLVYSTCSIFKSENDDVIYKFLSENDGFEPIITSLKLNGINTKYGTQFLPHISGGVGFYVCKLKRVK